MCPYRAPPETYSKTDLEADHPTLTGATLHDPKAHDLGGAEHNTATLAELNAKISDADLDDKGDPRPTSPHDLGGAQHNEDTLADLNLKISDADLDDKGDPRPPLDHNPAIGTNDTGSGFVTVDTVGENVSAGEILYMKSDGKYWKADADAVGTMPAVVMAMETILADASGKLLHMGYFRHDAWTWTLGAGEANLLFAHTTGGEMVQFANKPSGVGDQVQVVGYVVTADIVFFNPSYELVEISA